MTIKKLLLAVLLLSGVAGALLWSQKSQAENYTGSSIQPCPTNISLAKPIANQVYGEYVDFQVVANTTHAASITKVTFYLDDTAIGADYSGDPWSLTARTDSLSAGDYQAKALVNLSSDGTYNSAPCVTNKIPIKIQRQTLSSGKLELMPSLASWRGPTNVNIGMAVTAVYTHSQGQVTVTGSTEFNWSTNLGGLDAKAYYATFRSGPTAGSGIVTIKAKYAGLEAVTTIPVQVQSYSSSATYPSLSLDTPLPTNIQPTTETTMPTEQGDAEMAKCLDSILGTDRYKQMISGTRLRFDEITQVRQCFVLRKNVVPANLAPVQPDAVSQLPLAPKTTKIDTIETTGNGKSLVLTGTATPEKDIFIYIFSEPLVLTTKTDGNGRWTVTLEDPLESGDHEAIVTVAGDNGEPLRSSVFGFAVAGNPVSEDNPLGLGLNVSSVASKPSNQYWIYGGGGAALIVVAGLMLYFLVWRQRNHNLSPQDPHGSLPG